MAITITASAHRTTGIGPLYVHFDATDTTADGVANPFHELDFSWNFGDPSAGNFAYGNPYLRNKNIAYGAVAGHVYSIAEGGGDVPFTATLTVTDGVTTETQTFDITVYDPEGANGFDDFYYFDPSGAFTGAPAEDATHVRVTSGDFDSIKTTYQAANRSLRFAGGQVFDASAASTITTTTGPWELCGFGSGRAIVQKTTGGLRTIQFQGATDGRVRGLDLDGEQQAGTGQCLWFVNPKSTDILLHDIYGHDDGGGIGVDGGGSTLNDQMCISECILQRFTTDLGVFLWGHKSAVLGCLIEDTETLGGTDPEHTARIGYWRKSMFQHNKIALSQTSPGKEMLTLRTPVVPQPGTPPGTSLSIVSDNEIPTNTYIGMQMGPPSNGEAYLSDVIIEREYHWADLSGPVDAGEPGFRLSGTRVTKRNCIVDATNTANANARCMQILTEETSFYTNDPWCRNLWLYNNSYVLASGTGMNGFLPIVFSGSTVDGSIVDNNLAYARPGFGISTVDLLTPGSGNTVTEGSNNSSAAQMLNNDPFVDAINRTVADGDLMPAGYAVGGGNGALPVFRDYRGIFRDRSQMDIGAFQTAEGTLPGEGGGGSGQIFPPPAARRMIGLVPIGLR